MILGPLLASAFLFPLGSPLDSMNHVGEPGFEPKEKPAWTNANSYAVDPVTGVRKGYASMGAYTTSKKHSGTRAWNLRMALGKDVPNKAVSSVRQTFGVPVDGSRLVSASVWALASAGGLTAKLTYADGTIQLTSRDFGGKTFTVQSPMVWEKWDLKGPIDEGRTLMGIEFTTTVVTRARGTMLIDDVEITEGVGKP